MYSLDTVRMAMSGGDEQAAGKKLQEAVEAYKKGKDTLKSIGLFKEAILLKPTPKAYYELAGALLTTRQYPEAIQALGMAEKLGYTPLANVMFRYAYASANMDSMDNGKEEAVRYMELAMQMGYAHPEKFLQKSLFPGHKRRLPMLWLFSLIQNELFRPLPRREDRTGRFRRQ